MSTTTQTAIEQVRMVISATSVGDKVQNVKVYVGDTLVFEEKAKPAIDPVANALTGLQGYMSRCPHKRVCVGRCADREAIPFTLKVEREWIKKYS